MALREILSSFLQREKEAEKARRFNDLYLVGHVLEFDYSSAIVVTTNSYRKAVGGIPRGSFLVMCPKEFSDVPYHFVTLRVLGTNPIPHKREIDETIFELYKRSLPELDVFTEAELQWTGLRTEVLGLFYDDPDGSGRVLFSSEVHDLLSPYHYDVYWPNRDLLDVIVNNFVGDELPFQIGTFRLTECKPFSQKRKSESSVEVRASVLDFVGKRTAMFGKTRFGKSNTVKVIAESIIVSTRHHQQDTSQPREEKDLFLSLKQKKPPVVGQLIFDINGEYANDNPQDNSLSLKSCYPDDCVVYALTPRQSGVRPLRLDFYRNPDKGMQILLALLRKDGRTSAQYVQRFASVELPPLSDLTSLSSGLPPNERMRTFRRIQIYWAILYAAGFAPPTGLGSVRPVGITGRVSIGGFDPGLSSNCLSTIVGHASQSGVNFAIPPTNLRELTEFLEVANEVRDDLTSSSGRPLFDADDTALLDFLFPKQGSGAAMLKPYVRYHDPNAGNFVNDILRELDDGKTVILDLSSEVEEVRNYYSDYLSKKVFHHQESKFVNNELKDHYIQLYFEEAHNLFPRNADYKSVYARFAKEGAKFHIGMVYSTQSPSTIDPELLAQTENFFVAHISSRKEVETLSKLQAAFSSVEEEILRSRDKGFMRILTLSHRFVIPVQIRKFDPSGCRPKGD